MSLIRKLQRLVFRPGEALLIRGRPSFRERDEFGERMRAFVALQNAIEVKPGESAKRGVRR